MSIFSICQNISGVTYGLDVLIHILLARVHSSQITAHRAHTLFCLLKAKYQQHTKSAVLSWHQIWNLRLFVALVTLSSLCQPKRSFSLFARSVSFSNWSRMFDDSIHQRTLRWRKERPLFNSFLFGQSHRNVWYRWQVRNLSTLR